jgi:predicted TIM-barrel fold metal-dependent hydrolase
MSSLAGSIIDVHCHVGLIGDKWPRWGQLSPSFLASPTYKLFLTYARVHDRPVTDSVFRAATEMTLSETTVDHVVCLALDWVHDQTGVPQPERSAMFVANEYVLDLRASLGDKVLLGASVHPYALDFEQRVKTAVDQGAVLLKWLPSAQDIDLASDQAGRALRTLGRIGPKGGPLPLLLHTGAEYAVPPAGEDTRALDFHSWTRWDSFWNRFRGSKKWRVPDVEKVIESVRAAVLEGAVIIFAHCGLPYFAPRGVGAWLEHSDFDVVRDYLRQNASLGSGQGRYYADVSACCTPFRQGFFSQIGDLPQEYVLFGSDFPTPVFELSADLEENLRDFKAVLRGDLSSIVVPQGNLLDVNQRELRHSFGDHPLFTNFGKLWSRLESNGRP